MQYGAIYIAHNPQDGEDTFKVGKTQRYVGERMQELTSSPSILGRYTATAYFVVTDIDSAERACHSRLQRYRVQQNREFFQIKLPKLVKIVQEECLRYTAENYIRKIDESERSSPTNVRDVFSSASSKLVEERRRLAANRELWNEAVEKSKQQIKGWFPDIRHEILLMRGELKDENSLTFNIPVTCERDEHNQYHFCTFRLFARLTEDGPMIRYSARRGGIYGDVDLSKATSGSIEIRALDKETDDESEVVFWQEADDGRIGRISLFGFVFGALDFGQESGELSLPTPKLAVEAVHYSYDDVSEKMKEVELRRNFSTPSAVLEVITSLLADNLAEPQSNVRIQDGFHKSKFGKERPKFVDRGQFSVAALR
jgi:hypothetical protein